MTRRAIVAMLRTDPHDHVLYMLQLRELEALTKALGYEVVDRFTQTNIRSRANYLLGAGKIEEIEEVVNSKDVELVVLYNVLSSKQKLNLSLEFNCEVIDRYELTLRIFEEMASDRISNLQIELARTRKLYPYYQLQAAVKYSGKERAPPWAGTGEFAFHSKMKGIQKRIGKLRREITVLAKDKARQIQERRKLGAPLACIAGYYNAGKTTLFNLLTGENKLVGDRPFKTLSSKYQKLRYGGTESPLLIDTIGFVVGLDPVLIKSFELNLMDMIEADLLLFMIGVDDEPDYLFLKLKFGLHLLQEIGVDSDRIMIVLNKCDLVDEDTRSRVSSKLEPILSQHDWTIISAKNHDGVSELVAKILAKLKSLQAGKVAKLGPVRPTQGILVGEATADAGLTDPPLDRRVGAMNTSTSNIHPHVSYENNDEDEEEFDRPPSP